MDADVSSVATEKQLLPTIDAGDGASAQLAKVAPPVTYRCVSVRLVPARARGAASAPATATSPTTAPVSRRRPRPNPVPIPQLFDARRRRSSPTPVLWVIARGIPALSPTEREAGAAIAQVSTVLGFSGSSHLAGRVAD